MATSRKKQKHWYLQRFCETIFPKTSSFWTIFGFWSLPKPTPPFPLPHLKFKDIHLLKNIAIFGARDASGASFFDGIYDVFCTSLNFFIKKCNFKNDQKITKKSISSWCLAVFGFRPLRQTRSSPGPFLTVFAMFYAHRTLFKKEPFFGLRGRVGGTWRLPL